MWLFAVGLATMVVNGIALTLVAPEGAVVKTRTISSQTSCGQPRSREVLYSGNQRLRMASKPCLFQLVLDPAGGIGIAVDSDGHPVERTGVALEYKRREIPLMQGLR